MQAESTVVILCKLNPSEFTPKPDANALGRVFDPRLEPIIFIFLQCTKPGSGTLTNTVRLGGSVFCCFCEIHTIRRGSKPWLIHPCSSRGPLASLFEVPFGFRCGFSVYVVSWYGPRCTV